MSGILLREADNLVDVTRLLNEESRTRELKSGKREPESKAPVPWAAATTISTLMGQMSKPQLTQDWVDALGEAGDAGDARTTWHKLTKCLPLLEHFLSRFR